MPEDKAQALTIAGVASQVDAMFAPPTKPDPPPYWSGNGRAFPRRAVLLDPDTGAVIVGTVYSGTLEMIDTSTFGQRRSGQQRLTLELRSMDQLRDDPEGYLRRALSMACDMAAQL